MKLNISTAMLKTIIVSTALVATGCSEPETAASYIAKAQGYSANNQVNESIIEYKNAIKAEPNNAAVRYMLGRLYLNQGLGKNAIKELERAKDLKYDNNLVIPALARAYFIGDDDNGISTLENDSVNLTDEAKNQFGLYLIIAKLRTDQLEQAKAQLIATEKVMPDSFYTLLSQAYVNFAEQDFPVTKELVSSAVALEPKQPEGLMLQAQLAVAMGDYTLANESLETYLVVQPQSNNARLLISNSYLQAGDFVNAEKYADQILSIVKSQPFANYVKAMVRMEAKDYTAASEHAELALQNNFNSPNLSLVAGASAFYLKNYEKSYAHLNGLINFLPPDHFARRMLVVSQLELGIVDNIVDTVSGVEASTDENAEFLSMLSYKLLEVGAYSEAKELVNQVGKIDSASPERNLREGVLKLMLNDPSAMDNLKQAVALDPDLIKAELALAFSAVKSGDLAQAQTIATKWQTQYPSKVEGFNLQAAIDIRQKDVEKAKKSLLKSLSLEENNAFALSQLARIAQIEKDDVQAKKYAEIAYKHYPDNVQVLRQYFDLHRDDKSLAVIKTKVTENPEELTYLLLYAEALTKLSIFNDVVLQLSSVKATVKTPKLFWQLKVNAYQQLNNKEQILLTLEDWKKTNPYHLEAIVYLAEYHAKNRDFDRALRVINQGFEQHKDNLVLELMKIQVLLNDQNSVEAEQVLRKIEPKIANKNIVQGIKGRIALIERKFNQASEYLGDFYQAFPTTQNVVFYTLALKNSNKGQVAITVLEQHLAKENNAQVQEFLATLYIEVAQNNNAISLYEKMLADQPQNIVVLNNLAWLTMEQGNYDAALTYAEKAFSLDPNVANVVDTYSQILVKLDKNREALEKAKLAYDLSKEQDIDIALNYIDVLIINSRKNEAKSLLDKVITQTSAQTNKKNLLLKKL